MVYLEAKYDLLGMLENIWTNYDEHRYIKKGINTKSINANCS
jgi:hypothetical protein